MGEIRSPGFGPAYWQPGQAGGGTTPPSSLPMSMVWSNPSSFEITEVNTFAVDLTIDAASAGIKTRGWDYTITIENNTDPTNVYLTGAATGTVSAPGTPQTFTVNFHTDSFLTHGSLITQPSNSELMSKFGPVYAGDSDSTRYASLLRLHTVLPTAYRNQLVESIVEHVSPTYPYNFDVVSNEYNKFAILMKIVRSNATAPAFTITDYKMFIITFSPLIDIE